jgi:signal transduction histidine kinase
MTNVIKHAKAKHVGIDLHLDSEHVRLTVWDDGQGMAADEFGEVESFGLYSLRETIQSLEGTLTIRRRDPGTQVELEIPLTASLSEDVARLT